MSTRWKIVTSIILVTALLSLGSTALVEAQGDGGRHHHGGWGHNMMLDIMARQLRMTPRQVVDQVRHGQTLAGLAETRGVDPQHLVDAYLDPMEAMLGHWVAFGHGTQEQADWMLARMAEQAAWCLTNSAVLAVGWDHGHLIGFGWGYAGLIPTAAEVLGMTPWKVRDALHEGRTLAELADEQGIDPQDIVEAYVAQWADILRRAVDAGHLTQTQADWILEQLAEQARWLLTNSAPMLGFGHHHGGHH